MGLRKRTAIAVLRDEIDWLEHCLAMAPNEREARRYERRLFEAREALAKLDD